MGSDSGGESEIDRTDAVVAAALADLPWTDVSALFHTIALQAQTLTGADYAALGIGADPERPFQPWLVLGVSPEVAAALDRPPRPVGILGIVARSGEVARASDVHEDPRFGGFPPRHPEIGPF